MIRILSVFGTRPEAIKMAPVIKELARHPGAILSKVCVTAQHRQMLDQVLDLFGIIPDYDLGIMTERQSLSQVTSRVLTRLDDVVTAERPDWILVHGDTTTTLAASLVAYYHRVKLGHVEAGLRTGDKFQPYPEEINRKLADALSDLHFAATASNRENLIREGIDPHTILVTGNTVIDALLDVVERLRADGCNPWKRPDLAGRRVIAVTAHRRENFGQPLVNICHALQDIARAYSDVIIIYPVHRNPNVRDVVYSLLSNTPGIILCDPLDYASMVGLLDQATLVLTDSGGLQEEAPSLGKPVLVMRAVTERPEAVQAGTVRVVGTERETIVRETARLLDDPAAYAAMAQAINPYGDGKASERIAQAILAYPDLSGVDHL
jgi:UDP-N-acetylglucosamine 2-epimerase (non-hydrolysing)